MASLNLGSTPPSFSEIPAGQQVYFTGNDELGNEVDILGCLAETVSLSISSDWQPIITGGNNAGLLSFISHPIANLGSTLLNAGANLTGYSGLSPALTQQIWRSSGYLETSLSLTFNAISDVQQDVIDPVNALNMLQLPSVSGGVMRSPGPSFLDINNKYSVQMFLGKFLFNPVIVKAVSTQFDTTIDRDTQFFNSVTVDVTVATTTIITKDVFTAILQGNTSSSATQTPLDSLGASFRSVQNFLTS